MKVPLLAAAPLLAALAWAAALAIDPSPLSSVPVLLIALSTMASATVGMVGITITGGRWAHRTSLSTVGSMLVMAVVRPIDAWWVLALVCTLLAIVALLSPTLIRDLRRLPPAASPPWRAVLLPLILIWAPFLLGLAAWDRDPVSTLVVGLSAPVAGLWYARVLPGGLSAVRLVWPALAVGLAFLQPLAPGAVSVGVGVAVAALAWHPSVRIAFHPPQERGTVHPIPPELAPRQVLDAAEIDERGRRRR